MSGGPDVFEDLLAPISEAAPAGESLRFSATVDAIKEARRADDATLPRGVWTRDLKAPDHRLTITLCRSALQNKSKDLLVAVWLVEAEARSSGVSRIAPGLAFLGAFCEAFWDTMYPEFDGREDAPRFGPLIWLDGALDRILRTTPLTERRTADAATPLSWSDYATAQQRDVGLRGAKNKRAKTPADRLTAETFLQCLGESAPDDLSRMAAAFADLHAEAEALDERLRALAGPVAPSFTKLAAAHHDIRMLLEPVMKTYARVEIPPEKVAVSAVAPAPDQAAILAPTDRRSAYNALAEVIKVLRGVDPHSPTIALLARAHRWRDLSLGEILADLTRDGQNPEIFEWLLHSDEPEHAVREKKTNFNF